MKVNVSCSGCRRRYSVEVPAGAGTHVVNCPYCSAPYSLTVNQTQRNASPTIASAPVSSSAAVAAKVRRCEVVSSIAWIVVGVVQCVAVFTAAAGVWNIINAIIALRNVKNIQPGNSAVVPYFDQRKVWLIVLAVVNLILGGVVGVLLVLFEWHVRDFVLRNRSAFEG